MSGSLLGIQIDAVYHTALVFGDREYFFGAGVQTTYPGATHHGRPMEIVHLGRTELPLEVILEYLESLKAVYTAEVRIPCVRSCVITDVSQSYDLFLHNCNNFSNDFAMFLIGKGIPKHITSLPQTVLNTPFGQMLKPQLDSAMRGITQAPVPPMSNGNMLQSHPETYGNGVESRTKAAGIVHNVTKIAELDTLLTSAESSCAIIFFTSSTCAPCKIVYPAYDELAAEASTKAVLIKVDLNIAYEIGARYKVRATPTFMTFLKGERENEWSGANEGQLRSNAQMLIQMAHPPHPHSNLKLPTLQRRHKKSVTYTKVPPLEKLIAKMGPSGKDPAVTALRDFIAHRESSGAADAPLPSLPTISAFILESIKTHSPDSLFPSIDLLRLALVDPRVSGYFAEEPAHITIHSVLSFIASLGERCPYTLRIVTLQLSCNLFTTSLFPHHLISDPTLATPLIQLVTSSLLDTTHAPIRVAAASLAFNITAFDHLRRLEGKEEDLLAENLEVELIAGLLEAVEREKESKEGLRGLLLAVGLLAYAAPREGEVVDLCGILGAKGMVSDKRGFDSELDGLVGEVEMVVG